MDALSDVLRTTRLKGGVFLHAEFSDPWCLGVQVQPESCSPFLGEAAEVIPYHYVLEGQLRVRIGDAPTYELQPGELVLFPRNDHHPLGGDLSLPPIPSTDVVKRPVDGGLLTIKLGGDGPRTRIVCGFLAGEKLQTSPVMSTLPALLHLDYRQGASAEWIRSTFKYAAAEIAAGRMGSETVFAKLSELLFVVAVRRGDTPVHREVARRANRVARRPQRHPFVSRALALLHARLRDPWTVDALGREIGLSRSALAERFIHVIGMPPMQYLTRWRTQVAAQELRNSGKSIPQIAEEVGYDSEASLTRAFKRLMGVPPAAWRRQRQ